MTAQPLPRPSASRRRLRRTIRPESNRAIAMIVVLVLTGIGVTNAAVSWGSQGDTGCWDEYDVRGTRFEGTVIPKGIDPDDCTPGFGCYYGYRATDGRRNRLYVPFQANPKTACERSVATTTTMPSTTTSTPTTLPPAPSGRFDLLPIGAPLPTDADCTSRVRSMTENRPENVLGNSTAGAGPDSSNTRVTGAFVGTTDEILQWVACKWGVDEDMVRAQMLKESNWKQTSLGDFTTDGSICAPGFPIDDYPPSWPGDRDHDGECPESIGIAQVRYQYHRSAFEQGKAAASTAYNLDYAYSRWRACFEGELTWLNTVDGRGDYRAGDALGCAGVWFSGRWYDNAAGGYIQRLQEAMSARSWTQSWFPAAVPDGGQPPIVTTPPSTSTSTPTTTTTTQATTTTTPTTTTTSADADDDDHRADHHHDAATAEHRIPVRRVVR